MEFGRSIPLILFALRCTAAATLGYLIAQRIGLPYPLWTAISALVVSQEQYAETHTSVVRRVVGTLAGLLIVIAVNAVLASQDATIATQMAVAIAISASLSYGRPSFRASLFTCPIVLMTAEPHEPMYVVAFYRGCEVILGGLLGGGFHYLSDGALVFISKFARRKNQGLTIGEQLEE